MHLLSGKALVLSSVLSLSLSSPTEPSTLLEHSVLSSQPYIHYSRSAPTPWARLRNSIIERIWGPPPCHRDADHSDKATGQRRPAHLRSRYGDEVVLRFRLNNVEEADALFEATETLYLDVWEWTTDWVDIRLSKDVLPLLLGLLPPSLQRSHAPLILDLPRAVYDTFLTTGDDSHKQNSRSTSSLPAFRSQEIGQDLFFLDYQPLSVVYPWMRLMNSLFPSITDMITIGYSTETRPIQGLRISAWKDPSSDSKPRETILIIGGSHAREWISVSTVTYIAHSLITRYGTYNGVTKFLNHFDVVLVPTLNPDGYVYTWEEDRLWRKNRQSTPLPFCHGIDLDRAFDFAWDGAATRDNPCSESYAGATPFAAIEAKALADWARNETESNNVFFTAFLDLHSYSQQVLYPYSYSCQAFPPSLEDLEEVATDIAKGFRLANGYYYGVSSACEGSTASSTDPSTSLKSNTDPAASSRKQVQPRVTPSGGSALDWFYQALRVKYSYQVKLRDTGSYGFLLPKTNIVPTGQEGFGAVMALARYLLGNRGIEGGELLAWEAFGINATVTREGRGEGRDGVEGLVNDVEEVVDVEAGDDEGWRRADWDLRRRRRRR